MMKRHWTSILFIAAFILSPIPSLRFDPNRYAGGRSRDERARIERNSSAIATILGEIRASMSDMMFIKTERYLHAGVAYVPHIDMEELSSTGRVEAVGLPEHKADESSETQFDQRLLGGHDLEPAHREHEEEDDDKFVATVIHTAADDFRSFIGDLERKVKPWHDPNSPHRHESDGTELLPWYRLMTLSDPHNIRAYMIGGWWLKSRGSAEGRDQAQRFIEEGMRHNPDSFQLALMRGYILLDGDDDEGALGSFAKAARLAADQYPPPDREPPETWTNYQEEDARAAVRLHVLLEKKFGSPAEALRLARYYEKKVGGDAILERQIRLIGTGVDPAIWIRETLNPRAAD